VERFGLLVPAVCLMPNHYHLQIETPKGNLGMAMQWLKTAYTVYFNRRHRRNGHLFQGRYKATLVEKESHLVELTPYIHLNPVRAALVVCPGDYAWSSYGQYMGARRRWKWLETAWMLEQFGGAGREGQARYRRFVGWVCEEFLSWRQDVPAVS